MSKRKKELLAETKAAVKRSQLIFRPYNACEVKIHWKELTVEKWIEACQHLYGELESDYGKTVTLFGPWEKALLEFFFLGPYAFPLSWQPKINFSVETSTFPSRKCRSVIPEDIQNMKSFPQKQRDLKKLVEKVRTLKLTPDHLWNRKEQDHWRCYVFYTNSLIIHPLSMQIAINSIFREEESSCNNQQSINKKNSCLAQQEAAAVLEKFKFGQRFSLFDSCVIVIRDHLMLKLVVDNTVMKYSTAVDFLPLPELLKNIIDPVTTQRFGSANCPMYKLVASFAKGQWLNTPLQFKNILDCQKVEQNVRSGILD